MIDSPVDTSIFASLAGRYRVAEQIGQGGMSTVYRALDLEYSREVAIKVLQSEVATAVGTERFLREVQIASRLQHPHILPLLDSGEVNGLPYYVMPFVRGDSLRDRLKREGQLPLEDALKVVREVGEALAYAHREGVVHRDVKPSNILQWEGHALVSDFGIARAISEAGSQKLTGTGLSLGTPAYMSPEQSSGEAADGRSDQYSLACVLFEVLAGEPPFSGRTARAVMAKHMAEPPPSIEVLRPSVPAHVATAIRIALQKIPADRFETMSEFVEALDKPTKRHLADQERPARGRRTAARVAAGLGLALVVAAVGWFVLLPETRPLDANKVVVFPFAERGLVAEDEGAGYDVALMIGAALEQTEPLKWIDARPRVRAQDLDETGLVTAAAARSIAEHRGARWFIDGFVRTDGDSATVVARLHDAAGDSLVAQNHLSVAYGAMTLHQVGVRAAARLLPSLVDPGHEIDISAIVDRNPAAQTSWLQGERAYRSFRFADALGFYLRSVEQDSLFAQAAIKGAQSASWLDQSDDAEALLEVALARDSLLPARYRPFARGLRSYLRGEADTALVWLNRAVEQDPDWGEAWFAVGETYYHLLPTAAPLDSLAQAQFEAAWRADSSFAPPLYHLMEIAARRGESERMAQLADRLETFGPDARTRAEVYLMLRCVGEGPESVDWGAAADQSIPALLQVGWSLAAGAYQPACAEAAFRAILDAPEAERNRRWGALLGLQGICLARGRDSESSHLVDSAVVAGTSYARALFLIDGLADARFEERADSVQAYVERALQGNWDGVSTSVRWLSGAWYCRQGRDEECAAVQASIARASAAETGTALDSALARSLEARLALNRGDTVRAVELLSLPAPSVRSEALTWDLVAPMAPDRLLLARLLAARGDFPGALAVASVFDHPEPTVFVPFVPESLRLRAEAAEAIGDRRLVERYRERLARLDTGAQPGSGP